MCGARGRRGGGHRAAVRPALGAAAPCPAARAAWLLLAAWGATAYALAAPAYLLTLGLSAVPRRPLAAEAWLPPAAEAPLFAAALLDAATWAKTGLHLPDFYQTPGQLWASLKGIRTQFLGAAAAALLAGALLSWATGALAQRLTAAAARRAGGAGAGGRAAGRGGCAAWPGSHALHALGVLAVALAALQSVESLRTRALACGGGPPAAAAAWSSLPLHLPAGPVPACRAAPGGGARARRGAAVRSYANSNASAGCPPPAKNAARAAAAEFAAPLDPGMRSRPDVSARTPRSAVIVFVDSLPAREFVSDVPESARHTSPRFRRDAADLFSKRGCRLMHNHFAASSYTNDGLYAALHGFLPFEYAPPAWPWCVPVNALRQAGYETGMFMSGEIGWDYCTDRSQLDGGCTKQFETLKVRKAHALLAGRASRARRGGARQRRDGCVCARLKGAVSSSKPPSCGAVAPLFTAGALLLAARACG